MRNKTILVTQHEAARELGVSVKTLRRWNCPKYAIGASPDGRCRKVRYNVEEVRTWLRENRDVSHASDNSTESDDLLDEEDDLLETGHVRVFIDVDVFKGLLLDRHLNFWNCMNGFAATNDVFSWLERKGFIRCGDPQNRPPDHED